MSPFSEDEAQLPDNWEPSQDTDSQWRIIRELMADADQPEMPPPAMFAAVREEVRRDLLREGLLRDKPGTAEPGFSEWLKMVFFGGRAGGQIVRLGAAMGLAFFVGTTMTGTEQVTQPDTTRPSIERPASNETASRDNQGTVEEGDTRMANAITPSPTPLAQGGPGGSVNRSVWEDAGWDFLDTAPASQAWMYDNGRRNGTAAQPVASASKSPSQPQHMPQSNDLVSQALEQLQMLKFRALTSRDEKTLEEIRRVEQTIAQLVGEVGWESDNRQAALTNYRRGEQALSAHRYYDAQRFFGTAADMAPGSFLSFLATYQIGRIAFEVTGDFATARQAYRQCLEEFPPQYLTGETRETVIARIERLEATRDSNWEPLQLWQAAERANSVPAAVANIHRALQTTTYAPLIGDLTGRLAEIIISDSTQQVDPANSIALIRRKLPAITDSHQAARMHLAIAEILNRRMGDDIEAAEEYRQAWQLSPDQDIRQIISQRLRQAPEEVRQSLSWPVTN